MQVDDAWVVEPYAVQAFGYPLAGDRTGGGLNMLYISCKPVLIAIAGDASCAVAAHLAEAAVGIVKQQLEIAAVSGFSSQHKPVGAYTCPSAAQGSRKLRYALSVYVLLQCIYNNEVVSGSMHFREFHPLPPKAD